MESLGVIKTDRTDAMGERYGNRVKSKWENAIVYRPAALE